MFPSATVDGLILTRQTRDHPPSQASALSASQPAEGRAEIVLWLATAQGPVCVIYDQVPPSFWLLQRDQPRALALFRQHKVHGWLRPSALKTFEQAPLVQCCFTTLGRLQQAQVLLQAAGIAPYEADLRHVDAVLIELGITNGVRVNGHWQQRGRQRVLVADQLQPLELDLPLRCVALDVECAPDGMLYSVALQPMQAGSEGWVAIRLPPGRMVQDEPGLRVQTVADERALLVAVGKQLQRWDPDCILGWNVVNFDFRLLLQRAERLSLPLYWGRGNAPLRWREGRTEGQGQVSIAGRLVLDGISSLKIATWQFESFRLQHVATTLLGEGKLLTEGDNQQAAIDLLWHTDPQALVRYNLQDCRLVNAIFEQTQLLSFLFLRSQLTGLEPDRAGGSVAAFSWLYLRPLHQHGYVAPNMGRIQGEPSPGGYVMSSRPGLYRQVLVLDFKSLYPSIIRSFGIDPLALVLGLQCSDEAQTVPGYLGARFARDQAILPGLIARLWQARDQAKADHDAPRSQAIKILMNSFYGVLGSSGCRFFDPRLASSITLRGQWIMQETARAMQALGLTVIYGDTDSLFVWAGDDTDDQAAVALGQRLAQEMTALWQQRLQDEFGLTSCMELQFERHYRRFLMPTIRGSGQGSKKRYAGLTGSGDSEKLIFRGLETVRSDWTELAKQFQQGLYQHIFHDEDPGPFIRDMVRATRQGEHDAWLVYHRRLRRELNDYQKNEPPHVRAARLAEALESTPQGPFRHRRGHIDYLMTTAGPEPVGVRQHAIDYEHYVEKQLRPVAEAILPFIGRHFDEWANEQLSLF